MKYSGWFPPVSNFPQPAMQHSSHGLRPEDRQSQLLHQFLPLSLITTALCRLPIEQGRFILNAPWSQLP